MPDTSERIRSQAAPRLAARPRVRSLAALLAVVLPGPVVVAASHPVGEPDRAPLLPVTPVQESERAPQVGGQRFFRVAASTFVPYDDDTTWTYFGAGCIHRTGGTPFRDIDVQIPNGSEIDFLRLYFYDNDPSNNAGAFLFTFDGAGGFTNVAGAMSSGTPGQSSAGSGFFSHFVDTVNQALTLRLDFGGSTNSNLRICGVRLRYTAPPLIFADGFETGDVLGWSRRVP